MELFPPGFDGLADVEKILRSHFGYFGELTLVFKKLDDQGFQGLGVLLKKTV